MADAPRGAFAPIPAAVRAAHPTTTPQAPAELAPLLHALLQPLASVESALRGLACLARIEGAGNPEDLANLADLSCREVATVRELLDDLVTVAAGVKCRGAA